MAVTISRTAQTDDDGSGTTGTIWNNAWKTSLYAEIDVALALLSPVAGSSSIVTVGTITSGVWNAGAVTSSGAFTSAVSAALTGLTNNLGTITSGVWNAGAVTSSGGLSGTTGAFSGDVTLTGNPATYGVIFNGSNGGGIAATHASGVLRFYSGGTTLRGYFDAGGTFYVTCAAVGAHLDTSSANTGVENVILNRTGSDGVVMSFTKSGVEKGSISFSGATTTYATSSDARLKRPLTVVTSTDVLSRAIVRDFEWLSDGKKARGVFAQEAYTVVPSAVLVGTDDVDADGRLVKPWSVDYSKFVPDLIVGWQQHDATIHALTARLAQLEGVN